VAVVVVVLRLRAFGAPLSMTALRACAQHDGAARLRSAWRRCAPAISL